MSAKGIPVSRNDKENNRLAEEQGPVQKRLKTTVASSSSTATPDRSRAAVQETLTHCFGFSDFRDHQWSVIEAALAGLDVGVFWATGAGKSLCYQLPALHLQQTVLVVSPLLSLMQDQVHKLNGTVQLSSNGNSSNNTKQQQVAVHLGSSQQDPQAQARALAGDYRVVYVTPEKLMSCSFLDDLARAHAAGTNRLALVAVDEAHCVSEWGHDFRPDFLRVGKTLRAALPNVPLMSLTATATPRVQQDLIQSLQMKQNVFVSTSSLDRTNLHLAVQRKAGASLLAHCPNVLDGQSTLIYASTRATVEELVQQLEAAQHGNAGNNNNNNNNNNKDKKKIRIEAYHAGLSLGQRQTAHDAFLTGQAPVVVATVAFGMGIDKPDTRRILHWGPPKTMEEYYQQVGRAGRDGLPATCVLYTAGASDFDKYASDFYMGQLSGAAKTAVTASTRALCDFTRQVEQCRRVVLLQYFGQVAPYQACGTCDVCASRAKHGGDLERDFGTAGGWVVLAAVQALDQQGVTQILKILAGGTVEAYRYRRDTAPAAIKEQILNFQTTKDAKKYTQTYYRELISPLVQRGYVDETTKSATVNGFKRSWTVYQLSAKGREAWQNQSAIMLPVPEHVRELERQEETRRQKVLANLQAQGVKVGSLPPDEVAKGDGEVIRAFSKWHSYLEGLRKAEKDERLAQVQSLLAEIEAWRSAAAVAHTMAPAAVLAEHTLVSIAYMAATLPPGVKVDGATLEAAGVRTRELDRLVQVLSTWVEAVQPALTAVTNVCDPPMQFPNHAIQGTTWQFAVYKPQKKTGKATWEASYDRFAKGESPQTIAVQQQGRQPIQAKTVVGHLLEALVQGKPVALGRLTHLMPPPTQSQWQQLQAADVGPARVVDDPAAVRVTMTDFLRPILGDALADKTYAERTPDEAQVFGLWCDRLKWYQALQRANVTPTFGSS